jgi:hypothetical protein
MIEQVMYANLLFPLHGTDSDCRVFSVDNFNYAI